MIVDSLLDINFADAFYDFSNFFEVKSGLIKFEGLNAGGSIKLKTAQYIIKGLEEKLNINPKKI